MATADTLVHRLFDVIDSCEFDRLHEVCHPTVVYERPGYEPYSGIDRLIKFYREERIIATGKHDLTAVLVDEAFGACWGHFAGKDRKGGDVQVEFADTYEIEDGKIQRRKTFFYAPAV